jgi:hypothetical protein
MQEQKTKPTTGLIDAAYALEEQAAGRTPDRARLLAGALALDTLMLRGEQDQNLLDAAAGLKALSTGETFELNEHGRARAALLATVVRGRIKLLNS